MGWFFASCGKSQNEKPINNLIIQLSKYNSSGYQKVYSFIQFVRSRNIRTNISIIPLEDKNDLQKEKLNNERLKIQMDMFNRAADREVKREDMKNMIYSIRKDIPKVEANLFGAITRNIDGWKK